MSYTRLSKLRTAYAARLARGVLPCLLAVLLLLAQTGFVVHTLEHQSTAPDAYCSLCLAAQHFGDALPALAIQASSAPAALPPVALPSAGVHAVFAGAFCARAPPARS